MSCQQDEGKTVQREGDPEGETPPGAAGLGGEAQLQRALEVQQEAVVPLVVPPPQKEEQQQNQRDAGQVEQHQWNPAGVHPPDQDNPKG